MISETGTVSDDLHCVSCRYNLRALKLTGRCPECGKPVAATLKPAPAVPDLRQLRRRMLAFLIVGILVLLFLSWFVALHRPPNYAY